MSAATEAVVAQWRPWIIRKTGEILDAQYSLYDDAQQEAMIRFWTRIEEGHPIPIALHAAKQAIIDVARGRRPTGSDAGKGHAAIANRTTSLVRKGTIGEEYEIEPPEPAAEQAYRQVETIDALEGALALLPDNQAVPIRAVYLEGMTAEDYAKIEGVSGQAVRYRIKKGMATMREHLSEAS